MYLVSELWLNFQMYSLLQHGADSFPTEVAEIMLKSSCEERGTVAGLAALSKDLDEEHVDGKSIMRTDIPYLFDENWLGNKEYALSP